MTNNEPKKKSWTLMFFLASDNTLSPSTLSQLKAIKAAGSHLNANVLVYFDPNEKGAPTRVYEINKEDKRQGISNIGNLEGPLVSVLTRDTLGIDTIRQSGPLSEKFADSLQNVDALQAHEALEHFLNFCREKYSADHYMLFLLGHGLVVGRDAFLPDDNPESAIGLKTLGGILQRFSGAVGKALQLVGMHSCSMSSVEVAYELKDTAKYMLASQGLSFVGSWPYRQMLVTIYKAIEKAIEDSVDVNVPELMKSLHSLCIQYSADFMYAGYSADICLCSLDKEHIEPLTDPISNLAQALTNGLTDPRCKELIVLAHWKSQSYWQETYSDLYDFCLCLRRLCGREKMPEPQQQLRDRQFRIREYDEKRLAIVAACNAVMGKLKPQSGTQDGPIVCTDFIGPDCQYSHGLSIYFPWAEPVEDDNDRVLQNYTTYTFTGGGPWLNFLKTYFRETKREDRLHEEVTYGDEDTTYQNNPVFRRALVIAAPTFQAAVASDGREFSSTTVLEGKISPPDSGGACACASTKNYSRVFSMSGGVAPVFVGGKALPAKP